MSVLGMGDLPAHRRPQQAQAPDPLLRRELKPILRKYAGKAPRHRRTRGLAHNLLKVWPSALDLCQGPRPAADQQPRRAGAGLSGHLPKALVRQQSTDGETRIARLLSAHPRAASSAAARIARRPLARRPHPAPGITSLRRTEQLPESSYPADSVLGDIHALVVEIEQARTVLGYEPSLPIDVGLWSLAPELAARNAEDRSEAVKRELHREGVLRGAYTTTLHRSASETAA
jgi:hypothetical protein